FSEFENPFAWIQNSLFTMSSSLYLALVVERTFAVRNAARYEQTRFHLLPLAIVICLSMAVALFIVYANFWLVEMLTTIIIVYTIEGCTLISSVSLIIYARRKYGHIPYDSDRLKAKYQVKEVLDFSMAILPSLIIGAVMHTLSLVPTLLWMYGIISMAVDGTLFYSVHSLNCILSKLTLIGCHKEMRQRLKQMFFKGSSEGIHIVRDAEGEGRQYFEQIKAAWDKHEKHNPREKYIS
ncbi:hypothetical protein PMAYCL1PPCAC_28054, partial [Pristionchus mayeri]